MTKALAICLVFGLWPGSPNHQNPQTHKIQQSPRQDEGVIKPSATPVNNAITPEQGDRQTDRNQHNSFPHWKDPQWFIVDITAVYTIFSGLTLIAIFRQNRSIQNTERAVLIPSWDNLVHINPEAQPGTLSHCFQWNFQNCGRTPAFIREIHGSLILLDSIENLPRKPDFRYRKTYQGDPLAPGARMEQMFYSPMADARDYRTIENEFRQNGKILFAYGFVRYDDIFGRTHETRFGLRYEAWKVFAPQQDRFVVDGPSAYNKYS